MITFTFIMAVYTDHVVPPYLRCAREIPNSLLCEIFILNLRIMFVSSSEQN